MAKVSVLQPNFIPWMGYFEIIKASDICVIYDTAAYSKNDFHNRNYMLLNNDTLFNWSLPLQSYSLGASFKEIKVNYADRELRKLRKTFDQNFHKSRFSWILDDIMDFLDSKDIVLSEVNLRSIILLMDAMKIDTKLIHASDLNIDADGRSEKLIKILQSVNATSYLSSAGAKAYLEDDKFPQKFYGKIEFMDFTCKRSRAILGSTGKNLSALSLLLEGLL